MTKAKGFWIGMIFLSAVSCQQKTHETDVIARPAGTCPQYPLNVQQYSGIEAKAKAALKGVDIVDAEAKIEIVATELLKVPNQTFEMQHLYAVICQLEGGNISQPTKEAFLSKYGIEIESARNNKDPITKKVALMDRDDISYAEVAGYGRNSNRVEIHDILFDRWGERIRVYELGINPGWRRLFDVIEENPDLMAVHWSAFDDDDDFCRPVLGEKCAEDRVADFYSIYSDIYDRTGNQMKFIFYTRNRSICEEAYLEGMTQLVLDADEHNKGMVDNVAMMSLHHSFERENRWKSYRSIRDSEKVFGYLLGLSDQNFHDPADGLCLLASGTQSSFH